ncbi:MAG: HAMP domain-containing histidine kinase [Oscillospiraceae bacterium]|nr:HAMP domain-containing histidine kinase [Oscillospiraceae bacterium]
MTKKARLRVNLNAKTLLVSFAGLALSLIIYLLLLSAGNSFIRNNYMSDESVNQRKAEIYREFANYVSAGNLSGRNSAAVARWTKEHDYITIYLFETGRARQSYSGGKALANDMPLAYDSAVHGRLYPVRFSDGIYHIAITDTSHTHQAMLLKVVALCCAGLAFLLLILFYTQRLTRRIIQLSKEAALVSSGDLWRNIEPDSGDELGMLAESMDEMRRSVIQRMGKETQAWQANSELITAISHDIRTPMTSLIGYLALLNDGGLENEEQAKQFAASAYGKAMELKDLTDQLFRYFLVYGKAELELNMESFDARLLLEQMLGEAEFDLSDAGFRMQHMEFDGECSIEADPAYLKRVFDNIVSNIKKYADKSLPVVFMSELNGDNLIITVSNRISRSMDRVESTKIGLRTCEKIMQAMQGSFTVCNDEDHFAVEIKLPAHL